MKRSVANVAIVAVVLLLVRLVSAGPVVPKQIGADAKRFVHVNFDAIRSMKLVEDFKLRRPMYQFCHAKAEKLAKKLGFCPMEDVLGLTLYCDGFTPHVGVGLLSVKKLDRERLVNFLREKHPDYKTAEYGNRLLYCWSCEDHGHHCHHEHCAFQEHHPWSEHHAWFEHHADHEKSACDEHHACHRRHHGPKHLTAAFASDTLIVFGTDRCVWKPPWTCWTARSPA